MKGKELTRLMYRWSEGISALDLAEEFGKKEHHIQVICEAATISVPMCKRGMEELKRIAKDYDRLKYYDRQEARDLDVLDNRIRMRLKSVDYFRKRLIP